MDVVTCQTHNELSIKAAALLVQELKKVISRKDKAVIAIPGGRSVAGLLQKLSPDDLDWSKVEIFMIDERIVSLDDKNSNFKQLYDLFLKRVTTKANPFLLEKGVEQYNREFRRVGRHFDIIILGVGEDGHIAALLPEHPALKEKTKKYIQLDDSPKPPRERVTASVDTIKDADVVLLIFSGAAKRKAYELCMNSNISVEECPAKIALSAKKFMVLIEFS